MADQLNHDQSSADAAGSAAAATAAAEEAGPSCRAAHRFLHFIYNRSTGQLLGRTPASWGKILAFYSVYYICLAGFFVGMLAVFLYGIISQDMPHRTGQNSLLQMNPGLGFRPQPEADSTLIEFTVGQPASYARHMANLQHMYDTYRVMELKPNTVNVRSGCEPDSPPDKEPLKVCKFNWTRWLQDCSPEKDFGFAEGKPCVLLKMNKIYGWLPDPVDATVPHPMVECTGDNPADREGMGAVDYFPAKWTNYTGTPATLGYFSQAYFPYLKQIGYRAPLVAVKFSRLRPNIVVMVQCVLRNLRNSQYSRIDRDAMVRFELFMKNSTAEP